MARPKLRRTMLNPPVMEGFSPFGIVVTDPEPVILIFKEYEAIRLTDYDGLTQQVSADRMNVSRPTFTRNCEKARRAHLPKLLSKGRLFSSKGATSIPTIAGVGAKVALN